MSSGRAARRGTALAATLLWTVAAGAVPGTAAGSPRAWKAAAEALIAIPRRVAYVTSSEAQPESRVWTAFTDGSSPLQLGPGSGPLISPDGTHVAAGLFGSSSESGPSLALYPAGGGAAARTGDLSKQTATPLAWSPDSRYLAVGLQSTAVRNVARGSGLGILDVFTGTLKRIATGIVYGASFAPDGSDRVVVGLSSAESLATPVDLYVAGPTGSGLRRLTVDRHSLYPVWGPSYIAYDRERLRRNDAPVYQLWLRRPQGGRPRQLTAIHVRSLVSGLVPLGFSQSGSRLLAEFVGQDTSEAWTVQVSSGRSRPVRVARRTVVGGGISRDGSRLLVYAGGVEGPADGDSILTVPFAGGAAKLLLAHAAQPSWNE
jgi:hypothetical protein